MKITDIKISEFDITSNVPYFKLRREKDSWKKYDFAPAPGYLHVMHVFTDAGLQGICTVGDARYTTMTESALSYLKYLAVGEDASEREYLFYLLARATRNIYLRPGWFGAFDNCLWDIEGQIEGKSVASLISDSQAPVAAYYNYRGSGADMKAAIDDANTGVDLGFLALKDHFTGNAADNIKSFESIRSAVGDDITLLHDAAGCSYSLDEALEVGKALTELNYGWFEEPFDDRELGALKNLCSKTYIPILALETLMNDFTIMREWVREGTVNLVRGNARHGTTGVLRIAKDLAEIGMNIELNGPGGLFGHVHAQLVAAIKNTSFYEYFPDGTRDAIGKEIVLMNPPIPERGKFNLPANPGWGYELDWEYFENKRSRVF